MSNMYTTVLLSYKVFTLTCVVNGRLTMYMTQQTASNTRTREFRNATFSSMMAVMITSTITSIELNPIKMIMMKNSAAHRPDGWKLVMARGITTNTNPVSTNKVRRLTR